MKRHPPYHLRINKAVDRWLLLELVRYVFGPEANEYRYIGMGGPFLEDFIMMHNAFPEMSLFCVESDEHTHSRQKFHRFSSKVHFLKKTFAEFLDQFQSKGAEIVWADYTDLRASRFREFERLLDCLGDDCMVKTTVSIEKRWGESYRDFISEFESILPEDLSLEEYRQNFPWIVVSMFQVICERAFPANSGRNFIPLSLYWYNDHLPMLSVTGVIADDSRVQDYKDRIGTWPYTSTVWEPPTKIDLPHLSIKERQTLNRKLPIRDTERLAKSLGYSIDNSAVNNQAMLDQYAKFYRYYPQFAKISW